MSLNALSIAEMPEFDLGDKHNSITAWLNGIRASGKPNLSAD